jgi:radical SAM superfamily enzyme YgiQ (UPF0313 family)
MRYPRVRSFSLERIDREITWAIAHGIRSFHILDPVLANADLDRLKSLHDIVEKTIVPTGPFSISVEVHAELLTEEMKPLLQHFTLFDIGLQTTTPTALRHIQRGLNVHRFAQGVEWLKQLNRQTNLYLILGLSGESFFSFLRSVRFCIERNVSRLFINPLCVLNGTALRSKAPSLQLRYAGSPPYFALSNYSFSEAELYLGRVFSETIVREHDAVVLAAYGVPSVHDSV